MVVSRVYPLMKSLLLFFTLLVVLLTGCSTVDRRIQQKSATFNSLDGQTQARLKQGAVAIGDTADMVYIAIGQPDRMHDSSTTSGHSQTWIYTFRWQDYEGSRFIGHRRETYYNPRTKSWQIYYEPVRAEVYRDREEEYMRVVLQDGKVTAIEKTKR